MPVGAAERSVSDVAQKDLILLNSALVHPFRLHFNLVIRLHENSRHVQRVAPLLLIKRCSEKLELLRANPRLGRNHAVRDFASYIVPNPYLTGESFATLMDSSAFWYLTVFSALARKANADLCTHVLTKGHAHV